MKISTKGQYALEALIDLQIHAVAGPENLRNVAMRRGISEPYLDQIFATLRKSGIVESIRGAQGGYRLAKEPGSITAGEILRSAEGPLYPVKCVGGCAGDEGLCPLFNRCATRGLWARMSEEIDAAVDAVTLADLISACTTPPAPVQPEYCI